MIWDRQIIENTTVAGAIAALSTKRIELYGADPPNGLELAINRDHALGQHHSGFLPEASAGSSCSSADLRFGRCSNRRRTDLAAIDSDRECPLPAYRGSPSALFGDARNGTLFRGSRHRVRKPESDISECCCGTLASVSLGTVRLCRSAAYRRAVQTGMPAR
jgi:hypothetical protein